MTAKVDDDRRDRDDRERRGGHGTDLLDRPEAESEPKTQHPSMYKVFLHNDDYTPADFVVHILQKIFGKDRQVAAAIMLEAHRSGMAVIGVYTYEIAETKLAQAYFEINKDEQPLKITMEKDS